MAYKCMFMDNAVYSANDVNEVFSKLASEGTVLFCDTGAVMEDLNSAVSNFASSGVTANPDSCLVVRTDDGYMISEGECIMEDGSMIIFSDGGEAVEIPENTDCYVYLVRNEEGNTIDILVSEEVQIRGICLAHITAGGVITDKRIFSVLKCSYPGANMYASGTVSGAVMPGAIIEVDTGFTGFKYLLYSDGTSRNYDLIAVDLSDGEYHLVRYQNQYGSEFGNVKKQGSKLFFRNQVGSSYGGTYNLTFEVR